MWCCHPTARRPGRRCPSSTPACRDPRRGTCRCCAGSLRTDDLVIDLLAVGRALGYGRPVPVARLGDLGLGLQEGVDIGDRLVGELLFRPRGHHAPRLADRVLELIPREPAPTRKIGPEASLTVVSVAVVAQLRPVRGL